VLSKIIQREEDAATRQELLGHLSEEMSRALPRLLADGKFDALEPLLEIGIAGETKPGIAPYVAFWTLRGRLAERIAHHQALAGRGGSEAKGQWELLAYLHRAAGDRSAAIAAARKCENKGLEAALLYEAGDWPALVATNAGIPDPMRESFQPVETLGFRAAFRRLAGNSKEFEELITDLKKQAEGLSADDPLLFATAKALFINNRPVDALALLDKADNRLRVLEVLCAQLKFHEAMQLVEKARALGHPELPVLELTLARHLYGLGEREKAKAIFDKYAKQLEPGEEASWHETLIDSLVRSGLRDQAFESALKLLAASGDAGAARRLFGKLYSEKRAEVAEAWWSFLRKRNATREPAEIMKDVRALLDGKLPPADVTDAVNAWVESLARRLQANRMAVPLEEQARAAQAIARACAAVKLEDLALAGLARFDSAPAWLEMGDILARQKKWNEAADRYHLAFDTGREQWNENQRHLVALCLYLEGHALVQAGKKEEGTRLIEQSHWLPLGDESGRLAFGGALADRGHAEAARHENELLLKLSLPASYYWGEAMRRTSGSASAKKDHFRAADAHERAMLRVLRTYVSFVYAGAYVAVPALVHRHRAAGFVQAGKLDDACREAELALAALPGEVELAILLVPALEKAGRKAEADALFQKSLAVYETICKEFPNCSWAHNSAAWLAACCRRDLDAALGHALKAVELAPDSAGHLDTLAEVYFQRGEKEKAVATQRKVVQMDPNKAYFRKQLARIEAGDPNADRPEEDDE
jgi:tetratricopeptide (TPR) repeat protein